jgi:predicted porin
MAAERVRLPSGVPVGTNRLSNYRSVLGFRGAEDLGDGLKAIWQLEGALSLDTGTGGFTSRDSRVGLAGPWGTLFAGVWALPYTLATSSFDPFYPTTAGYMALMGNGSAPSSDNTIDTSSFDRRQRNVIQFWTPTWSGVSARLAYAFNEESGAAAGAKPWLVSGSASLDLGTWTATFAHEVHRQYQTASGSDAGTKLGVSYSNAAWRLAGVFEHLAYQTATGSLARDAAYVSATRKVTATTTVNAGYARAFDGRGTASGRVGFMGRGKDTGASQFTAGGDYALSRRTSLFGYFSRIDNRTAAAYDFAINQVGAAAGQKPRVVALGIRHAF